MKNVFGISVFAAMLLCSLAALAQTDSTANKVLKKVTEALVNGDCDRAQRNYNIWKELAAKTNSDIEAEIKACKSEKKQDKGYVELKDAGIAVQTKDIVVSKLYYNDAKLLCEGSTLGGYKDWRLPTIVELSAIFTDKDKLDDYFFKTRNVSQSGYRPPVYWSSSVVSNNESAKNKNASVEKPIYKLMWMSDGQLTTSDSWGEYNYCRCVRSINEK
jgi:hypothetical protein